MQVAELSNGAWLTQLSMQVSLIGGLTAPIQEHRGIKQISPPLKLPGTYR